ncbi:hypothetical protein LG634_11260 [Streptomyces bambusae]|uniref:delta-60 repeat domain-containing protein n=1 Tax=Streptomyces bambusae TaxID=1550616 RepID=UPI001CFEEA98|nr:delta-60 repeat domain-containing protein [Streptomyces bambusae]MCB5165406.1 hypothetical protein [Streptomyces bambusae]
MSAVRPARPGRRRCAAVLLLAFALVPPGAVRAAPAPAAPDPGFGRDGRVLTDLAGTEDVQDLAVQADGRILTVGTRWAAGRPGDFAVVRHRPDGALDRGFGTGGAALADLGGDDVADGAAVQRDGRILVVGRSSGPGRGCCRFAVARLLPDGRPDPGFGTGGRVLAAFPGGTAEAHAVAVRPDGRIVVAGRAGPDFALLRLRADGTPDPGFGHGGRVVTAFPGGGATAYDLVLLPDGGVVAAGQSGFAAPEFAADFALARYRADGRLDPAFGTGGRVTTGTPAEDGIRGVALHPDGRLIAAGYAGPAEALLRFGPDGRPDPSFGPAARPAPAGSGPPSFSRAYDVAVGPAGRILTAGRTPAGFTVTRHRPDGRPSGRHTPPLPHGPYAEARAVTLLPDGTAYAAGLSGNDRALSRHFVPVAGAGRSLAPARAALPGAQVPGARAWGPPRAAPARGAPQRRGPAAAAPARDASSAAPGGPAPAAPAQDASSGAPAESPSTGVPAVVPVAAYAPGGAVSGSPVPGIEGWCRYALPGWLRERMGRTG